MLNDIVLILGSIIILIAVTAFSYRLYRFLKIIYWSKDGYHVKQDENTE